jgi:hypothetical protein
MSTIGTRSSQGLGVGSRAFPTIPTNVIAYRSTLTSTIISWSAPLVNGNGVVSSYRVEFSTDGSTWSLVGDTSNLTLTHSGLNDSVSSLYRYRVSATNSAGFGPSKTLTGTVQRYGGPGNWTVPAGVTRASVIVVGGGSSSPGGGGGGGGGGVSVGYGLNVSGTIPYVVGANGVNAGFSSSFGTTVLTATGGNSGSSSSGGSSGVGGGSGANILASTSKAGGTGQFNGTGGGGGAQTAGGNGVSPNGGAGGLGYTFLGEEKLGGGGGGWGANGNVIGAHDGRGSGANAQSSSQQGKFGLVAIQYFV